MGFSLENIIDDQTSYQAPDHNFISSVSGLIQSFPWERFERFFESRPLVEATATEQIFLLRVLAIQELLCVDDDEVLAWLRRQLYLSAFLSPGLKPRIPSQQLLTEFRHRMHEANLLEPFRLRCQKVILRNLDDFKATVEATSYIEEFAPDVSEFPKIDLAQEFDVDQDDLEGKWVICPKCDSSSLRQVRSKIGKAIPQASCQQCGHSFKV